MRTSDSTSYIYIHASMTVTIIIVRTSGNTSYIYIHASITVTIHIIFIA